MTKKPEKETALDVPLSEIPLPPEDLTDRLDNAEKGAPQTARSAAGNTPAEPAPGAIKETADLDFLSEETTRKAVVKLDHPFRLDGKEIREIAIRKLTVAEIGTVSGQLQDGEGDSYDIYAVMTGLPAPVLRGLIDDDGEEVVGKAYDFLPRRFRTA